MRDIRIIKRRVLLCFCYDWGKIKKEIEASIEASKIKYLADIFPLAFLGC
jgi:hypothetical protein